MRDLCHKPIYWEDGDSHLKAHLHLPLEAKVSYKEGEGNRTEIKGGGCKIPYVQTSTGHSDKTSDDLVHHPGLVILASWMKVSKSPEIGMLEG